MRYAEVGAIRRPASGRRAPRGPTPVLQPKPGADGKGGLSGKDHQMLVTMTRDQVMDEDYAVLKGTRPRQAASPAEELLVETDVTLAQVRKMTRDYAAKFGEVDAPALAALRDTHIRVLPCPGHRSEPGQWVHRLVPLKAAVPQDATQDMSRVALIR